MYVGRPQNLPDDDLKRFRAEKTAEEALNESIQTTVAGTWRP